MAYCFSHPVYFTFVAFIAMYKLKKLFVFYTITAFITKIYVLLCL